MCIDCLFICIMNPPGGDESPVSLAPEEAFQGSDVQLDGRYAVGHLYPALVYRYFLPSNLLREKPLGEHKINKHCVYISTAPERILPLHTPPPAKKKAEKSQAAEIDRL